MEGPEDLRCDPAALYFSMSTINRHLTLTRFKQFAVPLLAACILASCSTYSKVSEKRPRYLPLAGAKGILATVNAEIVKALQLDRHDHPAALAEYLTAAQTASLALQRNRQNEPARQAYNFAVSRIIGPSAPRNSIRGRSRCEYRRAAAILY